VYDETATGLNMLSEVDGTTAVDASLGGLDDRLLVTAGSDQAITLWQLPAPQRGGASRLASWSGRGDLTSIAASADGNFVVTSSRDGSVRRWSVHAGGARFVFDAPGARNVELTRNAEKILISYADHLELRDLDGGNSKRILGEGWSIGWSGDWSTLVGMTTGGMLAVNVAENPDTIRQVDCSDPTWSFYNVDYAGKRVCVVSPMRVTICDPSTGREDATPWALPSLSPLSGCALSSDGQTLAVYGAQGAATFDVASRRKLRSIGSGSFAGGVFTNDGRRLFLEDSENHLWSYELADGVLSKWPPHGDLGAVTAFGTSVDDETLVTAGSDGVVRIFSTRDGRPEQKIYVSEGPVTESAFSADAKTVVTLSGSIVRVHFVDDLDPDRIERMANETVTRPLAKEECGAALGQDCADQDGSPVP
jgi:WD40 repeat protein